MCERCNWATADDLMIKYHDTEWGVPLHDDQRLFEFLTLESFQAGLSWRTVLHKREAFRKAFDEFDPEKVATYDEKKKAQLMTDKSIIRNRQKIDACVNNAKCFLKVQQEFGSFDKYVWKFVGNTPIVNNFTCLDELPAKTLLSDKISADLKSRGFKFIGSTVAYAHMQATGMINDHLTSCFRFKKIINSY
ncbi:DNA-3-methyladenine glycosylase I [Mariniphaga anaerophila]|uniref:DNA-3-methyladenine glycosylase I n=1 Tax=Mariniphaga anaerophila TaxID=1484053 RepID=A0A1M5A0U2_9BACT|nr:DNA-3-methyladenine glycosylase I [Mariniphaga anaerophila]SHF23841.1 DNA-3-methyladenine glycosylase I [Mariniphaga anaerophila]